MKGLAYITNNYKFNAGSELNEDLGLNLYETPYRNYDQQLGRFNGIDQLAELTPSLTPMQFGYNNPIASNDPSGLMTMGVSGGGLFGAILSFAFNLLGWNAINNVIGPSQSMIHPPDNQNGQVDIQKTNDNFDRIYVENNPVSNNITDNYLLGQYNKGIVNIDKINTYINYTRNLYRNDLKQKALDWYAEENTIDGLVKDGLWDRNISDADAQTNLLNLGLANVLPNVILKSGTTLANTANEGKNIFKHSYKYADRVRLRAIQDPVSHNFPYSFDDVILSTNPLLKNNGYKIFQQQGAMNGKSGFFEIGLTKNGIIDHRFFRPFKK